MELILALPLWFILIQLIGSFVNAKEFAPVLSLKKYLLASNGVSSVDALSFNSFITLIFFLILGQILSINFIITNEISFLLALFSIVLISVVFLGVFRFRLSIIRHEVLEQAQITICQLIIITAMVLTYKLLQTNSFLIRLAFELPLLLLFYATELEMIRTGSQYTDKSYVKIQCSYIRLLFQSLLVLFFLALTFVRSDLAVVFKDKFNTSVLFLFSISAFVFFIQTILIVLSNIYIKFQPLRDYTTITKNSKRRAVFSLLVIIIMCILKVSSVF